MCEYCGRKALNKPIADVDNDKEDKITIRFLREPMLNVELNATDEDGYKADLCPVCKGTGIYQIVTNYGTCTGQYSRTCHGCDGKGWVIFPEISTSISGS